MSNRFFNFVNQFVSGAVVKSAEVNTQFAGVETGMAAIELELNRAIKFPSAESATNQVITPNAASRIGYVLGYDASGALVSTNQYLIDWDVNNKRMRNLVAAIANDEPVTLGQLAAYSADLAGLPAITAQNGPLITDGATVSWGARATTLLPTAPTDDGGVPVYSNGTWASAVIGQNIAVDPNGAGSGTWTTSLTSTTNEKGRFFSNAAVLAADSFNHYQSTAYRATITSGSDVTASAVIGTAGLTAGTAQLKIYYYRSNGSLLGETLGPTVAAGTAERRYMVTAASSALAVTAVVAISFVTVSGPEGSIVVRDAKLESGSRSTPWSDHGTTNWIISQKAQNSFGGGQTTPIITLGDASSATATYDFRSATGSQLYDARIRSSGGTNGTVGKATLAITAKSLTVSGPIGYPSEYDAGNSGSAVTIDFLNGPKQKLTLNAATPAITISTTGLVVGHYQLKVIQDPASARVVSWVGFAAGDCAGNAVPVITTTLSGVTFVYFYWDGAQFWVTYASWD